MLDRMRDDIIISSYICVSNIYMQYITYNIYYVYYRGVQKESMYQIKNGKTENSKGNKTVPGKVATACTEDGHRQTTKTSTTI